MAWLAAATARRRHGADRRSRAAATSRASGLTKLAEYQVPTTRELEDIEVKKTAVWTLAG